MISVIFICTGNICRSPMAEGIFKETVHSLGRFDVTASSMGIHGLDFQPASQYAIEVCAENNIDISSHLSRPLFPDELRDANLILTMEPVHKEFLNTFFPAVIDRVNLLGCWPAKDNPKGTIADPIGGPIDHYRKTFRIIQKHIQRVSQYILSVFPTEQF